MKNKKNVSTEIIEIPEYELINKRLRCSKCANRHYCKMESVSSRSQTGAQIYCQIFAKHFYTVEFIAFLIIEIWGILKIFSLDKGWIISSAMAVAYTATILIFENFISKTAKFISENKEIKRKAKYDNEVSKIKESNDHIKRMQKGETEEYLEFINKANNITNEVIDYYCIFRQMQMSKEDKYFVENLKIVDKFQNLSIELENTTKRLNSKNYHPNYKLLQTFYGSYIKALIEKMKIYSELYKNNKLTLAHIEEYDNLLDNFINKINVCNEKIDEAEGQEILDDIRQLNNLITSENINS